AFEDKAVRDEKGKVLRVLRPITGDDVRMNAVRGQYGRGFIEGVAVNAYREEPGVARDSRTETYVALKCWVDNWRWEGTPFYMRTGKRLPKRSTEIAIQFRSAPHQLFSRDAAEGLEPTALVRRSTKRARGDPSRRTCSSKGTGESGAKPSRRYDLLGGTRPRGRRGRARTDAPPARFDGTRPRAGACGRTRIGPQPRRVRRARGARPPCRQEYFRAVPAPPV